MNTQNVKTATKEPSKRWEEKARTLKFQQSIYHSYR